MHKAVSGSQADCSAQAVFEELLQRTQGNYEKSRLLSSKKQQNRQICLTKAWNYTNFTTFSLQAHASGEISEISESGLPISRITRCAGFLTWEKTAQRLICETTDKNQRFRFHCQVGNVIDQVTTDIAAESAIMFGDRTPLGLFCREEKHSRSARVIYWYLTSGGRRLRGRVIHVKQVWRACYATY